jgi:hypothetical protein
MIIEAFTKQRLAVNIPNEIIALAKARGSFSSFGKAVRTVLRTAIASYNVWFWFRGTGLLDNTNSCAAEIFLFARVALQNRKVRQFYRTIAVLYLYFTADDIVILLGKFFIRILRTDISTGFKTLLRAATPAEGQKTLRKQIWAKWRSIYVHLNDSSQGIESSYDQEGDGQAFLTYIFKPRN